MNPEAYMEIALRLSKRQLGKTWPNPAVGCVLVRDGFIIGRGVTQDGGRPHAEIIALQNAKMLGNEVKGAQAYISLEPCSHIGKTPPCVDSLITAGIETCYIACEDPDKRVAGTGIAKLKAAGIKVKLGILAEKAQKLHQGYFLNRTQNRPLIALKIATSLDGKIALKNGKSQWITSDQARKHAHSLRHQYDAIMIGSGTLLLDDPALTCRIKGMEAYSPLPIIVQGKHFLPTNARLYQQHDRILHFYSGKLRQADLPPHIESQKANGHERLVNLADMLEKIAKIGITRLLVEGGASLFTSFLKSGLIDRLYHYQAPLIMGNDGLAGFGAFSLQDLRDSTHLSRRKTIDFAQDQLHIYEHQYANIV